MVATWILDLNIGSDLGALRKAQLLAIKSHRQNKDLGL
jgi:hypothetical protein